MAKQFGVLIVIHKFSSNSVNQARIQPPSHQDRDHATVVYGIERLSNVHTKKDPVGAPLSGKFAHPQQSSYKFCTLSPSAEAMLEIVECSIQSCCGLISKSS